MVCIFFSMREVHCFISVKHVLSTIYSFCVSLGDKFLISNNSPPPGLDIAFLEKHWGDLWNSDALCSWCAYCAAVCSFVKTDREELLAQC